MNSDWQDFLRENDYPPDRDDAGSHAAVVVSLHDRAVLEISGADAAEFLHAQLISDITAMTPGSAMISAWCNPGGRVVCTFYLAREDDRFLLLLPAAMLPVVIQRLGMFVLRADVRLTELSSNTVCLGLLATTQQSREHAAVAALYTPPGHCRRAGGTTALSCFTDGVVVLAEPAQAKELVTTLAPVLPLADAVAWQLQELTHGIPWITEPLSESFLPQELGLDALGSLSLSKGCYPGQEIIARLHYRGDVKRLLRRAAVSGTESLSPGDKLAGPGDTTAGTIIMAVNVAGTRELLCVVDKVHTDLSSLHIDGRQDDTLETR